MRGIGWAISGIALLLPPSIGAAPSVVLTMPVAETRYLAPAAIDLAADPVVDEGRTIERVEFLADGAVIGTATQAPWSFSWTNVVKGNYNLRARVVDSAGLRDASPVVRIHVRENTAPKVRISAPEHRYISPGSVPLTATVTDRDDPIAKVEFFNGDALLATLTAEPYAISWTDVPAGDYDIRAKATDALGAVGTSNLFRVRVRDNLAPRVRILGPENNTTYTAPAAIPISLRAVDRDDNLTNVELFANGSPLATFTAEPFELNWTGMQPGTYALTARATDDLGLTTTSRTVNVTITGAPPTAELKMYFIHVDHLNTPRLIADEQQRTVWRWDQQEPFGESVPDENPSGIGQLEFPLRFPGQYFDRETNAYYNHFRDYDSFIGRYMQSDPIGLEGGINTYSYVAGSPMLKVDPHGLENPGMGPYGPRWSCGAGDNFACALRKRLSEPDFCTGVPDFFPSACKKHDACYDIPGACKSQCDLDLYNNILLEANAIEAVYVAPVYYAGVSLLGGPWFKSAQSKARAAR